MSDFITETRAALAARIRELAQDEDRAGLPATAAVYRECAGEVDRHVVEDWKRIAWDAMDRCDVALDAAADIMRRAEARHRRHLARLRWRRATLRHEPEAWESDRLLWRRRFGGGASRVPVTILSGPLPSAWAAYLAAEAAASRSES